MELGLGLGLAPIWACPVCGRGLVLKNRSYSCENKHTYDLAAKGYVNLLLANQRKSKEPGDSKQMLAARRNILQSGHFQRLSNELSRVVSEVAQERTLGVEGHAFTVLDAGCGEGYYLETVGAELRRQGIEGALYGTDISKDAIAMAAGAAGAAEGRYAVASSRQLPILGSSVDCVLQVFAPHSDSEFHRVLQREGKLVTVVPGKHHLYGLKELLYPEPYLNDEAEHPYPSFQVRERLRIHDELILTDPTAIQDLVMMTPYYWRTEPAMLDRLMERRELRTPLEFVVTVYGRA